MTVEDALNQQLRAAMRARDKAVVAAVRSALAALANAQAVPVSEVPAEGSAHFAGSVEPGAAEASPRLLTEAQRLAIVEAEITELSEHAERLHRLGRTTEADDTRRAVAVLSAACASP